MESPYQLAIRSLTARLHLPPVLPSSQSWEVEVADSAAIPVYHAVYESGKLTEMEKKVLVRIILESLEQAAKKSRAVSADLLQQLSSLIQADYQLHRDALLDWALLGQGDDADEHRYRITPFVRKIIMGHEAEVCARTF